MDYEDYSKEILTWFEDEKEDSDVKHWKEFHKEACLGLIEEHIPINKNYYIHNRISDIFKDEIMHSDSIPEYMMILSPGIVLEKIHYKFNDGGNTKTQWLTEVEFEQQDENLHSKRRIYGCRWIFRPLKIKNLPILKNQIYCYKMEVCKTDYKANKSLRICAYIETGLDGRLLKKINFLDEEEEENKKFPFRFPFPKQIISKINRYLANNFWNILWNEPRVAAWYCTDKGIAYYLGNTLPIEDPQELKCLGSSLYQECIKLVNGPNGDAASILLAYICFSVLKPFFSTYHALHKNSTYFDAKKYIPKQIAINVQSDDRDVAERIVEMCCGYFSNSELDKASIIDGICIQKIPLKLTRLSINEFESKMLQPACVLWVNRKPCKELIQSGWILDIHLHSKIENLDTVNGFESFQLVNFLTSKIHNMTVSLSNGTRMLGCLERSKKAKNILGLKQYSLELEYKTRLAFLSKYSRRLRSKYIYEEDLIDDSSQEIEKVIEIIPDLDVDIVEKIAYLSASFHVFAQEAIESEDQCMLLCKKVDRALISAYTSQLCVQQPRDMIENYILSLLKSGQCARIRGENSESSKVCVWYDPKENTFLIPSKDYFNSLKGFHLKADISKENFEVALMRENILCAVPRKNQVRRTFEVVAQKGGKRLSVLKINAAFLSDQFSKDACEFMEQMKNDKTPYRS